MPPKLVGFILAKRRHLCAGTSSMRGDVINEKNVTYGASGQATARATRSNTRAPGFCIRATPCRKKRHLCGDVTYAARPRSRPVRSERASRVADPASHRTTQTRTKPDDLARESDAAQAPGRCCDRSWPGVEPVRPYAGVVIERHMPVDRPQPVRIGPCAIARRRAGGALAGVAAGHIDRLSVGLGVRKQRAGRRQK